VCRPKHVEQLRNFGIINSTTRLHLLLSFCEIYITMRGSMNIKVKLSPCLRHCKDAWEWKGMAPRILSCSTIIRKRKEVTRIDSLHICLDILPSPYSVLLLYITLRSLCHFVYTKTDSCILVMTISNDEGLGWLMKSRSGWQEVYQYRESGEKRDLWNSFHDLGRCVNNNECTSSPSDFFIPGFRGPGITGQRLSRDLHPV
jgi:hypothetical protein